MGGVRKEVSGISSRINLYCDRREGKATWLEDTSLLAKHLRNHAHIGLLIACLTIGGVCLLCLLCSVSFDHWHLCLVSLQPAEIGVGLTAFGLLFTVLGVLFFFDRGLLAMGNVRLSIAQLYFHSHKWLMW